MNSSSSPMSRELAILSNLLLAEGKEVEAEQTPDGYWVLAHYRADGGVVVVFGDHMVAAYTARAWEEDDEALKVVDTESAHQAIQAFKELDHCPVPNATYTAGDAVKHGASGEVAVVVERLGHNRIKVSLNDRTDAVWYVENVEVV